ncbi:MAG: lysylphosphatidylglycerol synthase transmembrane domain-containing protein [Bacteroidota bacterium]|nr:lysylphosphatidylglycerol synthase transmembrane domain-containing protein [Bacteroidota bacterium]
MGKKVKTKQEKKEFVKKIRPLQIVWPILIGLTVFAVVLYFQLRGKDIPFSAIAVGKMGVFWLFIAGLFMITRDIGYIIRLKILSDNKMNWIQAARVIFLWEFTSSISPSAVGGTSVAVVFVHKEGISIGRSSAIVMATSFLDELYFIIMFPLLLLLAGSEGLFNIGESSGLSFSNEFFYFAVVGYTLKFAYLAILSYGLFVRPRLIKYLLLKLFGIKFLRRWRPQARRAGLDIIENSRELRGKSFMFWAKTFGATFLSWTARYWVVNAMFLAFFVFEKSHFLLFSRQLVMWIMMLVSPTPGGSGFSEFVFSKFLSDFMPEIAGIAIIMAFIWRLFTYYPYLLVGAIIVPKWIKDKFA